MKKLLSLLLVMVLSLTAIVVLLNPIEAEAAPYSNIEMNYSETVKSGTIRYISQIPTNTYFNSKYWPSSAFGGYTSSWNECGTSCISMALSYLGLNYTPKKILEANNGYTYFDGWKGATYCTYSASNLSTAIDKYLNGNGQYSPVVVHLDYGSTGNGHYVMIIDKVSSNVYKFVDPADSTVREYTINGTSINYKGYSNKIDQVCQWYNKDSIICSCDEFEGIGVCTNCGKTFDWKNTFVSKESGVYIVKNGFYPYFEAPYYASEKDGYYLEQGTTVFVTGTYTNAHNELWYHVIYAPDASGYIHSQYLEFEKYFDLEVTCDGFTPGEDESLYTGFGYPVWGSVSSNYPLKSVEARLDGVKYATWIAPNETTTKFEINPTEINQSLKFGSLSAGKHTVTLIATDIHGRTQTFLVRNFNMVSSSCSHSYSSAYSNDEGCHWYVCTKCGSSTSIENHIYNSDCDANCNICGYTRKITHKYVSDCDEYCDVCGEGRAVSHDMHDWECTYSNDSSHDIYCKNCTAQGVSTHNPHKDVYYGNEQHYLYCVDCDSFYRYSNHIYTNDCDNTCNGCDYVRVITHNYDNSCDDNCNTCGYIRDAGHTYSVEYKCDRDGHWQICSVCGENGTVVSHTPGAEASETTPQLCEDCGYVIREAIGHIHKYGDSYVWNAHQHWFECEDESCGAKQNVEDHSFDEGVVTKESTTTENGEITYTCTKCGEKKYIKTDIILENPDDFDDSNNGEKTDSDDTDASKKDHSRCEEKESGWNKFWIAIGNFFRMIFGLPKKCVCGEIL